MWSNKPCEAPKTSNLTTFNEQLLGELRYCHRTLDPSPKPATEKLLQSLDPAPEAEKLLINSLADKYFCIPVSAIELLGSMKTRSDKVIPALIKMLSVDDYRGTNAARALAKIGTPAVAQLNEALTNENETVRTKAKFALANIDYPNVAYSRPNNITNSDQDQKKENIVPFDYSKSLQLANDYLHANSYFKTMHIDAVPNDNYKDALSQGSYRFNIIPKQPEAASSIYSRNWFSKAEEPTNEITGGNIDVNPLTGIVSWISINYQNNAPRRRKKITVEQALQTAENFVLSNNINLNSLSYKALGNDEFRGYYNRGDYIPGNYGFFWEHSHNGINLGKLTVSINDDGTLRSMRNETFTTKKY